MTVQREAAMATTLNDIALIDPEAANTILAEHLFFGAEDE